MQSLRERGQVLIVVFTGIILVSIFASISSLSLVRYIEEIAAGAPVDQARAEAIDARQAIAGLLQVGLLVVCAIAFLVWFHRAHRNLADGGLIDLQYSPGWAVGGFFVPFLNLVRPFQVMKEVWGGSTILSGEAPFESPSRAPIPPLVGSWWALFLASSFLGNISGRMMMAADGLDTLRAAGWWTFASDLMDVPAALVALLLVRRVTDLQERARTGAHGAGDPSSGWPREDGAARFGDG